MRLTFHTKASSIVAATLVVGASLLSSPASAATKIVVAPSENGLVMKDVKTSIIASGFTGSGKLYRYEVKSKKWILIGSVLSGKARPYTFTASGATRLRVVPTKGKAFLGSVNVYAQFRLGDQIPKQYGNNILVSQIYSYVDWSRTVAAPARCVLVDIGLDNVGGDVVTIKAMSTGAPEFVLSVPAKQNLSAVKIPISGDAIVSTSGINQSSRSETWPPMLYAGVVWTCLNQPQ